LVEKAQNAAEEAKNIAEEAKTAGSAGSLPSEVEGEVSSLKRDIRCLKYELKKLKSVSDEPSCASEHVRGLKNDIHCLEYELKKLKSVSNDEYDATIKSKFPWIEVPRSTLREPARRVATRSDFVTCDHDRVCAIATRGFSGAHPNRPFGRAFDLFDCSNPFCIPTEIHDESEISSLSPNSEKC
jgi:hypothetical protein